MEGGSGSSDGGSGEFRFTTPGQPGAGVKRGGSDGGGGVRARGVPSTAPNSQERGASKEEAVGTAAATTRGGGQE